MPNQNNFRSFPLFNDVMDKEIQAHNRAAILVNIFEDNYTKDEKGVGMVTDGGTLIIIGYMSKVPEADRKSVIDEFIKQANERGFKIA